MLTGLPEVPEVVTHSRMRSGEMADSATRGEVVFGGDGEFGKVCRGADATQIKWRGGGAGEVEREFGLLEGLPFFNGPEEVFATEPAWEVEEVKATLITVHP